MEEVVKAPPTTVQCIVVGAGLSGLAAAKCLQEEGLDVVVFERSGDLGGLWRFREKGGYGAMSFTHTNSNKDVYCYSDFPFPDDVPDHPHHEDVAAYLKHYAQHFGVDRVIRFNTQVVNAARKGDKWEVITEKVRQDEDGQCHLVGDRQTYTAQFLAIASGVFNKPNLPNIPGLDTFKGNVSHSITYKDARRNDLVGKKVVVMGIGMSAVDIASDLVETGGCRPVYLSTRSGAWVWPPYVFGRPIDYLFCRMLVWMPWQLVTWLLETIYRVVIGHPRRWGLNPKMHVVQTQPVLNPGLINHLQRRKIKIVPDIERVDGNQVFFTNQESVEVDHLILATGYRVEIPFLDDDVQKLVLDEDANSLTLFKTMISADVGPSLAFIGFIQRTVGSILSVSETQARWFAQLCKGNVQLPSKADMKADIKMELDVYRSMLHPTARYAPHVNHLAYNDDITSLFGAKPQFSWKKPWLAWKLFLGPPVNYQWRLQGPGAWKGAEQAMWKQPVNEFLTWLTIAIVALVLLFLYHLVGWLFAAVGF